MQVNLNLWDQFGVVGFHPPHRDEALKSALVAISWNETATSQREFSWHHQCYDLLGTMSPQNHEQ